MNTKLKISPLLMSSAVALAIPLSAQAQSGTGFAGTVTLGYNTSSIDIAPGLDADLSGMSIDVETDITFSDAFAVGLNFGLSSGTLDILAAEVDLDLIGLDIEPVYYLGNGAYMGLYYTVGDFDLSLPFLPIALGADTESYGLFGGYESGPLWAEAFIGRSDTDPSLPDIDIADYGISGSYDINSQFSVFGSVLRADVDGLGLDASLTALSIGADYDFGNGLTAYGSVGQLNIDLGAGLDGDAKGVTLGLAYDLSSSGVPVTLNAEYSRTSVDLGAIGLDPEIDRFAVGVTIPLGGGSSTPLNSNTRSARGDYRSAIAALANSL